MGELFTYECLLDERNDVERLFADIEKNVLANSNSPTTEHLQERILNYLEVEYPKKIIYYLCHDIEYYVHVVSYIYWMTSR